MYFFDENDYTRNGSKQQNQRISIYSDNSVDWNVDYLTDSNSNVKVRSPPLFDAANEYRLCDAVKNTGADACLYGENCVEAHSEQELFEWKKAFFQKFRYEIEADDNLSENLQMTGLKKSPCCSDTPLISTELQGVTFVTEPEPSVAISSKSDSAVFNFVLRTSLQITKLSLVDNQYKDYFYFEEIRIVDKSGRTILELNQFSDSRKWISPDDLFENVGNREELFIYDITVKFFSGTFGTFWQVMIIDFGCDPKIFRHMTVDVGEMKKELSTETIEPTSVFYWNDSSVPIVLYEPSEEHSSKTNKQLLSNYPFNCEYNPSFSNEKLSCYNYADRMHHFICMEERTRYNEIARNNLRTKVIVRCSNEITNPDGKNNGTEFVGIINLLEEINDDTPYGRLLLNCCTSALIRKVEGNCRNSVAYEALLESKNKKRILLKLSRKMVYDLSLKDNMSVLMDVQFQLKRLLYCEWHFAVDAVPNHQLLFPQIQPVSKTVRVNFCVKLNSKQSDAATLIAAPLSQILPPVLIIGPFGTGKTYTLGHSIKNILLQENTRVLLCTLSNSAANILIEHYLDSFVQSNGIQMLRIYYKKRRVSTISNCVRKYCNYYMNENGEYEFKMPTSADIVKSRVVVVTLNLSCQLPLMGITKGYFTHILIDEAAQALECEAIKALALADHNTRIVLAGDHMQLNEEVYSPEAKASNFNVSLLERLSQHYPNDFLCKIMLNENYRSHEIIVNFISKIFYRDQLICQETKPRHPDIYPLAFYCAYGVDVQADSRTSHHNDAEVSEIVTIVQNLKENWPSCFGDFDANSIGVLTPYTEQVLKIRQALREHLMHDVTVERIHNIPGKQFKVVILSTVRSWSTGMKIANEEMDYCLLSNLKLLNTSMSRAESLIAVVGNALTLCSLGKCRKIWEKYISICAENNSLFGTTLKSLKYHLDILEHKIPFTLNPNAKEFIPGFMDLLNSTSQNSLLSMAASSFAMSLQQQLSIPNAVSNLIMQNSLISSAVPTPLQLSPFWQPEIFHEAPFCGTPQHYFLYNTDSCGAQLCNRSSSGTFITSNDDNGNSGNNRNDENTSLPHDTTFPMSIQCPNWLQAVYMLSHLRSEQVAQYLNNICPYWYSNYPFPEKNTYGNAAETNLKPQRHIDVDCVNAKELQDTNNNDVKRKQNIRFPFGSKNAINEYGCFPSSKNGSSGSLDKDSLDDKLTNCSSLMEGNQSVPDVQNENKNSRAIPFSQGLTSFAFPVPFKNDSSSEDLEKSVTPDPLKERLEFDDGFLRNVSDDITEEKANHLNLKYPFGIMNSCWTVNGGKESDNSKTNICNSSSSKRVSSSKATKSWRPFGDTMVSESSETDCLTSDRYSFGIANTCWTYSDANGKKDLNSVADKGRQKVQL